MKLEVLKQMDQSGRSFFYSMEVPPLSVDLDGDEIEEIVAPITQAPGQLAVVFRGPAGYRLQSVNTGFEGTITRNSRRRHFFPTGCGSRRSLPISPGQRE